MKDPALEEEALRVSAADGKLVIEQQTLADHADPVVLKSPSGQTQTVTPQAFSSGVWRVTVPAPELGLYTATQNGLHPHTTFFNVGPANPKEFAVTISSGDLLKPVADATSGSIMRMDGKTPKIGEFREGGKAPADTIGVRMTDAKILKGIDRNPLMPAWLGMLIMLGTLAGAWYREGDTEKKNKAKPQTPAEPKP
jgi:hypothetical protein